MLNMFANEIINTWIMHYIMIAVLGIGITSQVVVEVYYHNRIRNAGDILHTQDKLLKQIALKYESCYKLNGYVNDTYVMAKKYLYKEKYLGVTLASICKTSDVSKILLAILTTICAVCMYYTELVTKSTLPLLIVGVCGIMMLTLFDRLVDVEGKEEEFLCYVQDYLENTLEEKLRMTQVINRSTLIEEAVKEAKEAEVINVDKRLKSKNVVNGNRTMNVGIISEVIEEYL